MKEKFSFSSNCIFLLFACILIQDANGLGWTSYKDEKTPEPLPYDACNVTFLSTVPLSLSVYGNWQICDKCLLLPIVNLKMNVEQSYQLNNTGYPFYFEIYGPGGNNSTKFISFTYRFGEHGHYLITFLQNENAVYTYAVTTNIPPQNAYLPIVEAFCGYVGLAILYLVVRFTYKKIKEQRMRRRYSEAEDTPILETSINNAKLNGGSGAGGDSNKPLKGGRVVSIDTFRGICLTIMIFVNYGGGGYYFFNHSLWNGLTVADLVFPWFIFIMGIAIPISFSGLIRRNTPKLDILYRIVRRAVILFALGLFIVNGPYELYKLRVPGVLQRFGVAYLFVSLIVVFVPTLRSRNIKNSVNTKFNGSLLDNNPGRFDDIQPFLLQWAVATILPIIWLLVTFLLNVPGCGRGYLGPGGIGDYGKYENCTGGAAGYIDKLIFGEHHIYNDPTCKKMYHTGSYDPEGVLGNLTSIYLCFLGVQVGRIIITHKHHSARLARFIIWGIFWGVFGLGLCAGKLNDGPIPINKNIWSLSFIFVMAGTGFIFLSICYLFVDVYKIWSGAPFIFPGMNSIMIYVGSEVFGQTFPFAFNINDPIQHYLYLTSSLVGVSCWHLLAYYAYTCKFFINI